METSISLKTRAQDGTSATTTLSYVNPTASNANLKLYAQKLASLTSDQYTGSTKVDKTSLDDEAVKAERNIRIVNDSEETVTPAFSNSNAGQYYSVRYDGTGLPYVKYGNNTWFDAQTAACSTSSGGGSYNWFIMFGESEPIKTGGTITIGVAEDEVYDVGELVITLTGGNG